MVALPVAVPGDFPLSAHPLLAGSKRSTRLIAALAYFVPGPCGSPELATVLQTDRTHAWRLIVDLEQQGFVRAAARKKWEITPRGMLVLESLVSEITSLIGLRKRLQ